MMLRYRSRHRRTLPSRPATWSVCALPRFLPLPCDMSYIYHHFKSIDLLTSIYPIVYPPQAAGWRFWVNFWLLPRQWTSDLIVAVGKAFLWWRSQAIRVRVQNWIFCGLIGVGMWMRMETLLTHELGWVEHLNHPDMDRIDCCVICVLFYFLCFVMNLFVTRCSWSSLE